MVILLLACRAPDEATDAEAAPPPEIVTDTLADGVAGETYTAWLAAEDGEPPLTWSLTAGALPDGLVLNPAGAVSGTPDVASEGAFTLQVEDALGRADSVDLAMAVGWPADALTCGGEVGGDFDGAAGVGYYDVDFDTADGFAWVQVPLPGDDTTRIQVDFSGRADGYVYVALPGTAFGDTAVGDDTYAVDFFASGESVVIDLATSPDLATFAALGEPITLLVAAYDAGHWHATATCSNGPIFSDLQPYPTRRGEPADLDFDVVGDQDGVTIWTDDALPAGLTMSADGKVTGTPTEAGAFEITVNAEDASGRTRAETAMLGVYDVVDAACGEAIPWTPTVGAFDTDWWWDVDTLLVARVPVEPGVSSLTATLSGGGSARFGFADPGSDYVWYPGTRDTYAWEGEAALDVSPRTWPRVSAFVEAGEAYVAAESYRASGSEATLTIACDTGPRADVAALPAVLADGAWTLGGIGGTAPYTWAIAGAPEGLALSADGVLTATGLAEGASDVDVTVTDAAGATSTETYPLYVGADAACQGAVPLACGDSVSGTFSLAYFDEWDAYTDASTATFCLLGADAQAIDVTVSGGAEEGTALATLGYPGATLAAVVDDFEGETVAMADPGESYTGTVDATTSPALADYAGLPIFLVARAWEPGDWSLDVACR